MKTIDPMKTFIIGATEYEVISEPFEFHGEIYISARPFRKIRNGQWRRIYGRRETSIKLSELEAYLNQ